LDAKKLDNAQEIELCAGLDKATQQTIKGEIAQFPLFCRKEGMRASTVKTFNKTIIRLAKITNLHDSEEFKEAIATIRKPNGEEIDENTKCAYVTTYNAFLKSIDKTWNPPRYKAVEKLPFIPTEPYLDVRKLREPNNYTDKSRKTQLAKSL
jgi:hypothetical protein